RSGPAGATTLRRRVAPANGGFRRSRRTRTRTATSTWTPVSGATSRWRARTTFSASTGSKRWQQNRSWTESPSLGAARVVGLPTLGRAQSHPSPRSGDGGAGWGCHEQPIRGDTPTLTFRAKTRAGGRRRDRGSGNAQLVGGATKPRPLISAVGGCSPRREAAERGRRGRAPTAP